MKLSSPQVYPVTAAFEKFLIDQNVLKPMNGGGYYFAPITGKAVTVTAEKMHEMLGEYEHGTADVIDLGFDAWVKLTGADDDKEDKKAMLEVLKSIYEDVILTMLVS